MKPYVPTRQELLDQRNGDKDMIEDLYSDEKINMLTYRGLMSAIDTLYHYRLERLERIVIRGVKPHPLHP